MQIAHKISKVELLMIRWLLTSMFHTPMPTEPQNNNVELTTIFQDSIWDLKKTFLFFNLKYAGTQGKDFESKEDAFSSSDRARILASQSVSRFQIECPLTNRLTLCDQVFSPSGFDNGRGIVVTRVHPSVCSPVSLNKIVHAISPERFLVFLKLVRNVL